VVRHYTEPGAGPGARPTEQGSSHNCEKDKQT
jgi:hypothetical protein